ncbi:alpha/beta hydrolase [Pediococcus siamensis]|uniref:alpha/beta hydrolase n=1 Tax=Pediococcus siamensis TaxID=381829 RepID=UPI0039A11F7A
MATVNQAVLDDIKQTTSQWAASDAKRDQGLPTEFPDVQRFDNLSYGPAGEENLLDIYIPKPVTAPVATIINIHGGGNVYGSKELYQHYCLGWARHGFGVVNFNYRLAPQTPFPGALEDTAKVVKWVETHGQTYHLDRQNVFIVGDSAGGTLAFQYLVATQNEAYRKALGLAQCATLKVRGGGLNSGFYFIDRPGAIEPTSMMSAYFTPTVLKADAQVLRTEDFVTANFPPVFVMTANQDFLHDEGIRLDQFLIDHQLKHQFQVYGTPEDPREHVFQLNQRDPIAAEANHAQATFFRNLIQA